MGTAVDVFYRRVLSDDRISEPFDGVDMDSCTLR
jgi:truncated hemoglobin YjbI